MAPLSKSDFEPTLFGHTLSLPHFLSLPFWAAADQWQELFCRRVHRAALLPEQTAHYLDFRLQCAVSEFESVSHVSRSQAHFGFECVPRETKFKA